MTQRIFKDPDFRGAFRLHNAFREAKPTRVRRVSIAKMPKALMQLGELEFVGYRTTHNGQVARYMHQFASGSMPRLMAGPKRGQLFLIGGRYHVTDRGIVDLDARGQEIDDHVHGEEVAEPRVANPSTDDFAIGDRVEAEDKHGRFIVGRVTKIGPRDMVTIHDEDSHKHYSVESNRCRGFRGRLDDEHRTR